VSIKDILRLAELKPKCREKILGLNALKIKRRVLSSGDTGNGLLSEVINSVSSPFPFLFLYK